MPRVGETRRDDRYFRPDRNPVVLTGLRHESVEVSAVTFAATVIRPSVKANGIFSENGDAQVWPRVTARFLTAWRGSCCRQTSFERLSW